MSLGLLIPPRLAGEVAAAKRRRVGAAAAQHSAAFPLPIPPPQAGEGGVCGPLAATWNRPFQGSDKP